MEPEGKDSYLLLENEQACPRMAAGLTRPGSNGGVDAAQGGRGEDPFLERDHD